jgi:ATP-dependent Zn protease
MGGAVTERERTDQVIQKRHEWIAAYHEAGHALGCRLAGCPVVKATIVGGGRRRSS